LSLLALPHHAHAQPAEAAQPRERSERPRWGGGRSASRNDARRSAVTGQTIDSANARLVQEGTTDLAGLEGQPIVAVVVENTGKRWRDRFVVRSVRRGETLTTARARRALRELLATGRVADGRVIAEPAPGGARLRIVVTPRRLVKAVRVSGGELDTLRALSTAELGEGAELTEARIGDVEATVKELYRKGGYDKAVVRVRVDQTDNPMRVTLQIDVTPGDKSVIARRIFVIEPKYDKLLGDMKEDYAVEAGDDLDEDALIEADNDFAEALRAAGFVQAGVKHEVVWKERHAFLFVFLDTGPQYRFVFRGNRAFDDDELEDALGLETETPDASAEALSERVVDFYKKRGFLDVRVDTRERSLEDDALREVRFFFIEGHPVRVVKRLFACLPEDAPDDLSADDLGGEIDAFLEEELPDVPFLYVAEEMAVDATHSSEGGGSRAPPRRLAPAATYLPGTYERATDHVRELLHSKGYLNAIVGPVAVIRAQCDPKARAGRCQPLPLPKVPTPRCQRDARELPSPEQPLDASFTCVPDPKRSLRCAPEIVLHIPIQLGPETRLWDVVFEGNRALSSPDLAEIAELELGEPFSNVELDAAHLRIETAYKNLGYAYVSVRPQVDYSPDRTRARARFAIAEHRPVVITGYVVRGAHRTNHDVILRRLALCRDLDDCTREEKYFRADLARQSEEQIATLGTFSSVSIALEDPEVPQQHKRVIITVVEQRSQYIEVRPGFSTGDGFRIAAEYGHRNVARRAIGLTLRAEWAYLPDFLILDEDVRETFSQLTVSERLERRNTGSLRFPDIGLGPRVDLVLDAVDLRDNQRDFGLTRQALITTLSWRPVRQVTAQFGPSAELNDVTLFKAEDIDSAVRQNPALASLLRVPEGRTLAAAQRLAATWDWRDNALNATQGMVITGSVEHVTALPIEPLSDEQIAERAATLPAGCEAPDDLTSEFLKFTTRTTGYVPITEQGMTLVLSMAGGYNQQLTCWSQTYPDRLFYLGGPTTVRGFSLDEMVPEDIARRVLDGELEIEDVGVRGGNFYVNPRVELRSPIAGPVGAGVFLDMGNVWSTAESIESLGDFFTLRYTAGAGLHANTPAGPVAVDLGFKLVRREWESPFAVHFAIGLL
jgi:outer membrane protein assembly factor BamA